MLAALMFSSCGESVSVEYGNAQFFAMDTVVELRLAKTSGVTDETLAAIGTQCEKIVSELENKLSRTIEGSPVSTFNGEVDMILEPGSELIEVLNYALKLSQLTDGAYMPTIGALTELWDIPNAATVPSQAEIDEALTHISPDTIEVTDAAIKKTDPLVKLDLGGIGKGAAAQVLVEYLSGTGLRYGLVSMGGNVGVFGEKPDKSPFKIGVRDPDDASAVVGYIYAGAGFVAVSGDYERYIEIDGRRYCHILDPATGYPPESGLRSVAVWCQNGSAADALSTALYVMGVEKGLALYEKGELAFEAVFITADGRLVLTDGLKKAGRFAAAGDKYTVAD